jgi:hypothetical protein
MYMIHVTLECWSNGMMGILGMILSWAILLGFADSTKMAG